MSLRHSIPFWLGRITEKISPKFDAAFWRYLRLPRSMQIWRSSGKTRSGDFGVLISSGIDPHADYFPALFFENDFAVESLGHVRPVGLRRKIKELEATADLVALRLDRILARGLFDSSYIRVPEWVRSSLDVPDDIQKLSSGHNSLRQDLRLVRKYGYTVTQSHDETDFETFYQTMYLPHGHGRHGAHAHLRSRGSLQESFKHGVLLIIKKEGAATSGVLLERMAGAVNFAGIGVLGGDEHLMKLGALAAAYYFGLQYARENGFAKVDLGGMRPCCRDSLLRYKKKWGAVVENRPVNVNDYILRWRSTNRAVSALLEQYPLIVRDQSQLSALTISGGVNPAFEMPPGLHRKIEIQSLADLQWPVAN